MDTQLNYYLEDLKRLDEVTVTDLESLAVKFPFDQTIRLLLAEKLSFDENSKLNANLYSSSVFRIHSETSFELTSKINSLNVPNLIDFSTPSTIQDKPIEIEQLGELESIETSHEVFVEGLEDISDIGNEFEPSELDETIEEMDNQEINLFEHEESQTFSMDDELETISSRLVENVDEIPKKSKKNMQNSESTNFDNMNQNIGYTEWLMLLKPISDSKIKKVKKKKKKDKIKETAKKSIIKSDSIVSEPLANILALQGHYLEAKIMYQKLIDINPEKKDMFKSKIMEIDQLIDQSR